VTKLFLGARHGLWSLSADVSISDQIGFPSSFQGGKQRDIHEEQWNIEDLFLLF
jgi:hypothetical protein